MPQVNPAKMLQFIQVTSAFGKRALDQLKQADDAEKRAAALRPAILNFLMESGVIPANAKEAADKALSGHDTTLVLLKNAAAKLAELQKKASASTTAGRLGEGVDAEKTGTDNGGGGNQYDPQSSLNSPYVGMRTTQKKASDVALFKGLGLAH